MKRGLEDGCTGEEEIGKGEDMEFALVGLSFI